MPPRERSDNHTGQGPAVRRRTLLGGASVIGGLAVGLRLPSAAAAGGQVTPATALERDDGCWFGAFVKHDPDHDPGISEPEALESVLGRRLGIDHSFQHWGWPFPAARFADDAVHDRIPMLSWGAGPIATLAATARGGNDPTVRAQAAHLRGFGRPVFLRFTWEMDLRVRGYDPPTFRTAWRRVRAIFAEEGAANVAFVFCPTYRAYQTGRASAYWPGADAVDWVGVDGYARPTNGHASLPELFTEFYEFGVRQDKPMIICETGVHASDPAVRAGWLQQAWADLPAAFPLIRAMVYFETHGDADNQWEIVGDSQTEAIARALVRYPYFRRDAPAATGLNLRPRDVVVAPGGTVRGTLTIHNRGTTDLADLRIEPDGGGWPVAVSLARTLLRPGESTRAAVAVGAPLGAELLSTRPVRLDVSFRRGADRVATSKTLRAHVGARNLALEAPVGASSVLSDNYAGNAVSGVVDEARWISAPGDPEPALIIDLTAPADLRLLRLYSGYRDAVAYRVRGMSVQVADGPGWREVARLAGNGASPVDVPLDGAPPGVQRIRLVFTEPSAIDQIARVYEVEVFGEN